MKVITSKGRFGLVAENTKEEQQLCMLYITTKKPSVVQHLKCDECGLACKGKGGLAIHKVSHEKARRREREREESKRDE